MILEALTLLLAVGTFALAAATVWSTREQGWREERSAIRGALLEQFANARRWVHSQPGLRTKLAGRLVGEPTPTMAVEQLMVRVDLPQDLTAYLVWLVDRVARDQREYGRAFPQSESNSTARDLWRAQVDNLQSLVQLISLHAAARSHLALSAESFTSAKWLIPDEGPPDWRDGARAQQEAMEGRPPFPSGHEYAPAHPRARDAASYGGGQAQALARAAPGSGIGFSQGAIPAHGSSGPQWWRRIRARGSRNGG